MGKGIDYGRGTTNIDRATGIRFGVIPMNDLHDWAHESFEADYGSPSCPKCGNDAVDADSEGPEAADGEDDSKTGREEYKVLHRACGDYACDSCKLLFDGEDAFGEQPIAWNLDDGEYKATMGGDDNDIFILSSPYFTRAAFCSPCAPGACHLRNPHKEGERTYCFGHDWFEGDKAPYPVYSVETGGRIAPPRKRRK